MRSHLMKSRNLSDVGVAKLLNDQMLKTCSIAEVRLEQMHALIILGEHEHRRSGAITIEAASFLLELCARLRHVYAVANVIPPEHGVAPDAEEHRDQHRQR